MIQNQNKNINKEPIPFKMRILSEQLSCYFEKKYPSRKEKLTKIYNYLVALGFGCIALDIQMQQL
jgi:hypothetical protein